MSETRALELRKAFETDNFEQIKSILCTDLAGEAAGNNNRFPRGPSELTQALCYAAVVWFVALLTAVS